MLIRGHGPFSFCKIIGNDVPLKLIHITKYIWDFFGALDESLDADVETFLLSTNLDEARGEQSSFGPF